MEEELEALRITPNSDAPLEMSFLPVVPDEDFEVFPGISRTREAIVEQFTSMILDVHYTIWHVKGENNLSCLLCV